MNDLHAGKHVTLFTNTPTLAPKAVILGKVILITQICQVAIVEFNFTTTHPGRDLGITTSLFRTRAVAKVKSCNTLNERLLHNKTYELEW